MSDVMPCGCAFVADAEGRYPRVCDYCGTEWSGPLCPHNGYQSPCPECDVVPQPQFLAEPVPAPTIWVRSMTGTPGVDVPDGRGRTHLHRTGLELDGNPRVRVRDVTLLASDWHVLRRTMIEWQRADGTWETQRRETYDRGNGATILLHDIERGTVLLTSQFRYPVYVNGHPDGMLLETAAGLLDEDDPETAIRREAAEELGVEVGELTHVFDAYMSPGSVTERIHFFAAPYSAGDRTGAGGGVAEEGEDITAIELPFAEALAMIEDGRITDGKTIMLLQWAALQGPFVRRST